MEDVLGVLTLFCSGAAQVVCHALRVGALREQLEVEEEDGDRQEEEVEVESGESESKRVHHEDDPSLSAATVMSSRAHDEPRPMWKILQIVVKKLRLRTTSNQKCNGKLVQ